MEYLASQAEYEEAPVEAEAVPGVKKTYALIVKDKSFIDREAHLRAARQQATRLRQEAEAAAKKDREKREEERRKKREKFPGQRSFSLERGHAGGYTENWADPENLEDEENTTLVKGKIQHSS